MTIINVAFGALTFFDTSNSSVIEDIVLTNATVSHGESFDDCLWLYGSDMGINPEWYRHLDSSLKEKMLAIRFVDGLVTNMLAISPSYFERVIDQQQFLLDYAADPTWPRTQLNVTEIFPNRKVRYGAIHS